MVFPIYWRCLFEQVFENVNFIIRFFPLDIRVTRLGSKIPYISMEQI